MTRVPVWLVAWSLYALWRLVHYRDALALVLLVPVLVVWGRRLRGSR